MVTDQAETGMIGSSFETFLEEEGTLDAATEQAIERVRAYTDAEDYRMSEPNK